MARFLRISTSVNSETGLIGLDRLRGENFFGADQRWTSDIAALEIQWYYEHDLRGRAW